MHRLDNVNLFKLLKYTTETNLVNKIGGYADHQRNNDKIRIAYEDKETKVDSHHHDGKENVKVKNDQSEQLSILNSLRKVMAFLNCLNTADSDGKVVLGMEVYSSSTTTITTTTIYIRYTNTNTTTEY